MPHYRFTLPRGFILPTLAGLLILAVVISLGAIIFVIAVSVFAFIGVTAAIYRALFGSGNPKEHRDPDDSARIRSDIEDIPFTEYREIESAPTSSNDNNET
jgi:hypothetical protein